MEARGERTWCGQCQAPELWPENIPAVELYLAAETQWRHAGMNGVPTGLDYAGVRALLDLWPDPAIDRPARFADLQTLEREHLRITHERLSREAHAAATATRPAHHRRP
jgi:hypothetical protein